MPTRWGALAFAGVEVQPGRSADIRLRVSESYTADPLSIPVTVVRGRAHGPTLFVTATVHGDELNGVGILRELLADPAFDLAAGTLIAVPVANVPGFLGLTRRLPDRRDLNRSFPGSQHGSLTSRLAATLFREVVRRSDFGIDLHTAGGERTNYPQVRGDLDRPEVAGLARAFGAAVLVHGPGPDRSLRRTAVREGIPTIAFEAGSPRRFERHFIRVGRRGVENVLVHLGMIDGTPRPAPLQVEVRRSQWLRARAGGILDLGVELGQPLRRGDVVSVNTNPFGHERSQLAAGFSGIVVGLTQLPVVHPGDAVCHVARLERGDLDAWCRRWARGEVRIVP